MLRVQQDSKSIKEEKNKIKSVWGFVVIQQLTQTDFKITTVNAD
jgi:hypothetical protein